MVPVTPSDRTAARCASDGLILLAADLGDGDDELGISLRQADAARFGGLITQLVASAARPVPATFAVTSRHARGRARANRLRWLLEHELESPTRSLLCCGLRPPQF